MKKIIAKIIKHRSFVLLVFSLLILLSLVLLSKVKVNYDLQKYLPEDVPSTIGIKELEAMYEFTIPNARAVFEVDSITEALALKDQLKQTEGIQQVLWLDDNIDLTIPLETQDQALVEAFYTGDTALFQLTANTEDARAVLDRLYGLQEQVRISGQLIDLANAQKAVRTEILKITLFVVPFVLLILLLATHSWIEPLIFGLTIGVGIILNMGSNLLFGEISFITQSVASILQLAVSMDYAIFLLNRFNENRKQGYAPEQAMIMAVRKAFSVISSSAVTTLFGFLALVFMRFRIGPDLGIVMAKGILFSLLSVIIFLPCFLLLIYPLVDKTKHRSFMPDFSFLGRFVQHFKIPLLILTLLLLVPSFLGSRANHFIYGMGAYPDDSRELADKQYIEREFGEQQQLSLLLPKGNMADELAMRNALSEKEEIVFVISYSDQVGQAIPREVVDEPQLDMLLSEKYSQFVITAAVPTEGDKAFSLIEYIRSEAEKLYGDDFYLSGEAASMYDMKETIEHDDRIVNGLAVFAIAIVIMLAFRSLSLPVFLVLTIEIAIWINLAVPYFSGVHISYLGYLIVSTVQLGATVDYAILYTEHYLDNRQTKEKKEALLASLRETVPSLLPPALILTVTGFALSVISSLSIVSELGLILGRGAFLSLLLVVFVLPGFLSLFDRLIEKTTLHRKFLHRKDKAEEMLQHEDVTEDKYES